MGKDTKRNGTPPGSPGEIQIELGAEVESECVSWKISQMRQASSA
jgi:hypothetical protein